MQNPFGEQRQAEHWRLIPEIDKSARLQAFLRSFTGRLVLSSFFISILYSFGDQCPLPLSLFSCAAIFGLGLFRAFSAYRMLSAILLIYFGGIRRNFGFSGGRSEDWAFVENLSRQFLARLGETSLIVFALALTAFGALAWVSLFLLRRLKVHQPVIILFFFWTGMLGVCLSLPTDSWLSALSWLTLGLYSISMFSIAYFYAARPKNKPFATKASFLLQSIVMSPPFTVVRHPHLLEPSPQMPHEICQLKALKLLFWTRILALISTAIDYLLVDWLHWPHFTWSGIAAYNLLHLPWYQVLLTRLAQTVLLIVNLSVTTGVGISVFRLAGIYLPRAVCRPYLARSFNDYFRRVLFYYSEIILHLFFYPIYEMIYPYRKSRQQRLQLALFLALFIGGWIFHVVVTWQTFMFFGWQTAWTTCLSWLPYFALVGFACCLSALGWIARRLRSAPLALHFALNLLAHSLLLSFMQYSPGATLLDHLNFVRSMLPL